MKRKDEYRSNRWSLIIFLSAALGLAGCQPEGPAENAGQKIDRAVEKAGNKLEGAKKPLDGKAEKSGAYLDGSAITVKIKADMPSLKWKF